MSLKGSILHMVSYKISNYVYIYIYILYQWGELYNSVKNLVTQVWQISLLACNSMASMTVSWQS